LCNYYSAIGKQKDHQVTLQLHTYNQFFLAIFSFIYLGKYRCSQSFLRVEWPQNAVFANVSRKAHPIQIAIQLRRVPNAFRNIAGHIEHSDYWFSDNAHYSLPDAFEESPDALSFSSFNRLFLSLINCMSEYHNNIRTYHNPR
jgi:hypothetical protein